MKCPHCQVEINDSFKLSYIGNDPVADWFTKLMRCPNQGCNRFILQIAYGEKNLHTSPVILNEKNYFAIPFDPYQQYEELANTDFYRDYLEAKSIQSISPKASILLSKDCIKRVLQINIYSQSESYIEVMRDYTYHDNIPVYIKLMTEGLIQLDSETDKDFARNLVAFTEGLFDYYYKLPKKMRVNL